MKFGELNEHMVGIALKELVRRGIGVARRMRFDLQVKQKADDAGKMTDVVTQVDESIQRLFLGWIQELFGDCNIVAEEENLRIWQGDELLTLVFDPIDGTKALARQQSFGIATQICAVLSGRIIATCVGDINTEELFFCRPNSDKVHRIANYEIAIPMAIDVNRGLANQYLLLRDMPLANGVPYSRVAQAMFWGGESRGPLFKNGQTSDGSYALSCSRLWKGECGGLLVLPGKRNPWDELPPRGIFERLGFVHIQLLPQGGFAIMPNTALLEVYREPYEVLIIHQSRIPEFEEWSRAVPRG